jgi:5-methylcytosine-specific restriction endonuclease McrA
LIRTAEHNRKIGEAQRRAWNKPERRAQHSAMLAALWSNPEYREKQLQTLRAQSEINHSNPEFVKLATETLLKVVSDPEWQRRHSERMSGERNPCWKGGDDYPAIFHDPEFKRKVRRALGGKCFDCPRRRSADCKALDIHHRDGNKQNCDLSNFDLLCRDCHMKRHGKQRADNGGSATEELDRAKNRKEGDRIKDGRAPLFEGIPA